MTKICRQCGIEKDDKKFKKQACGRQLTCRQCSIENPPGQKRLPHVTDMLIKALTGRKYTLEHRLAISKGQKRRVKEGRNHLFKNVQFKEKGRYTIEYRMWMEQVKELRGNKCRDCEATERLQCHHVKSFYEFPDLRIDPENGELLCRSCHLRHHRLEEGKKLSQQTERMCKCCEKEKDINEFYSGYDKKNERSYRNHQCRDCMNQKRRVKKVLLSQ